MPRRHERADTEIDRSWDNQSVLYHLAIKHQNNSKLKKKINSILFGMARNATRSSPEPCACQELLCMFPIEA